MTHFYFQPIMSPVAIAAVAAVLVALLLFGPVFKPVALSQRAVLSGLRLLVVVFIVTGMLQPSCIRTTEQAQSATLLLLFDQSRSMQLPHESGGLSRWDKQLETLRANEPLLNELKEELDLDIKLYSYDTELHAIDYDGEQITLPSAADGALTDIGSPLDEAVSSERSKRLVGVILMGDGVQTAYDQRVEMIDAVDQLRDLQHPLWTVSFGPEGDAARSADVSVDNLPDQYSIFVKNELVVRGSLGIRSFANIEIPVQLIVEDSSGESRVVDTKKVKTPENEAQVAVEMTYVPQEPGQYKLTMRAVPQESEDVTKNNELSAFLTVFEGGLRILYLEGDLRMEQKFLRRSLDSSIDFELDFMWIDHRRRDRWPVDLAATFRDPQYNVVIIGDLDSRALFQETTGEENLQALIEAVEGGKGLITLGGYHSYGPGLYQHTPLADVLPIKMRREEKQDFGARIATDLHHNDKLQMLPDSPHYLTYLAPDDENEQIWRSLPPLDGANKWVGVKDNARILAKSTDNVPLLLSSDYGQGRVLAFAGDSTWRWWMQGYRDEHRRFWRQVILWLAKRDDLSQDDVWIKLPQRRYHPGSRVDMRAGARTAAGDVISDASYSATVTLPSGAKKTIVLSPDGNEQTGRIEETKEAGTYTIEVTATSRENKLLGTSKAQFMVYDHDVEKSNAAADPARMRMLASLTKESGGRPVPPEQLSELLEEIKRTPPELKIEVPRKWQLGDNDRDAWAFFLGIVGLLTVEWALRKKWGLV